MSAGRAHRQLLPLEFHQRIVLTRRVQRGLRLQRRCVFRRRCRRREHRENKRDVADVPDAILTAIQWQFYDSPNKAAMMAFGLV